ncbi:MAG: S-layer homology domain-containing protein [Clostridia bacterium]|nr:S-layer homology domain-containing protein [Clostridia bacterium]
MKKLYIMCLLIISMVLTMLPTGASAEASFADVKGHWAEEFVIKAANEGLFVGDSNGNFNPDANVTRAQFITVLWRMAGRPDSTQELPFSDTENQLSEFKKAIAWGYTNGYIKGTSETTFEPEATLTREAGMKILHLYSGGTIGGEFQFYAIYDGLLADSSEISSWAKSSVYWGIYNKLISGTTDTTISPKDTATRAQLARILVSYLDI